MGNHLVFRASEVYARVENGKHSVSISPTRLMKCFEWLARQLSTTSDVGVDLKLFVLLSVFPLIAFLFVLSCYVE